MSINEFLLTNEQKQAFSQQAIQIVEILQMSAQQLDAYLSELILSNPLVDPDASYQSDHESLHVHVQEENWGDDDADHSHSDGTKSLENWIPQATMSLSQQLYLQLLPYVKSRSDEYILRFLIDSLDERGYLTEEPECLCDELGLDSAALDRYVRILQQLEPAGLGARTLRECLLLQLERSESPRADLAKKIVSQHFEEIPENNPRRLAKTLGVKENDAQQALRLIQGLNPRPANELESSEQTVYIRPDIIIERDPDGFQIRLKHSNIHRLLIEPSYMALARDSSADVQAYIREKKQNIDWINRCLEQRDSTLMRLAVELLERQKAFFLNGPGSLRPMDQTELSEAMEVSPSTVSRAIRDKYLQCSWGVFPLKAFFPRAIQSDGSITVGTIKERIQTLIDGEDKTHPLSDQKICDLLSGQGAKLSRRVIAKYRGEMGIPDTSRRRRNASD